MHPDHPMVLESTHRDACSMRYHRHGISFATIVLQGSYTEVRDGSPTAYSAGSVVLHAPGEEHADYFTSAAICLNVELDDDAVTARALEDIGLDKPLSDAVEAVVRAFYTGTANLDDTVARLRASLASRAITPERSLPAWLEATIERFEWSSAEPIRAAAKFAGVHPTHFSREFHRYIGMTPNDFRHRMRVRRASDLLLSTNLLIASVAHECGFNDQSHLTRAFGTALGLSPALYRRTFAR